MFGPFLVSQQRLHFATEFVVAAISRLEEFSATTFIQFQCPLTKFFDTTPRFSLHEGFPCSIPATARFWPISSPDSRYRSKHAGLQRFLRHSNRRRISARQLCSSFHQPRPMRSRHRPGPPDSHPVHCTPTEPLPAECEERHRHVSDNRVSGQNRSECAASTAPIRQRNAPDPATSPFRSPPTVNRLH